AACATGSRGGRGSRPSEDPGAVERYYADGALGMGPLGQCNPKPRYAQTTGRGEHLENERREAKAVLFQPCLMHRPEPLEERQAPQLASSSPTRSRWMPAPIAAPINGPTTYSHRSDQPPFPNKTDPKVAPKPTAGLKAPPEIGPPVKTAAMIVKPIARP